VRTLQIYDGRKSFYQWDLNQKLTSKRFEVGDEIHFFNAKQSSALVTVAYELDGKIVVDVPNILLQSSLPITVYRYIDAEDSSKTVEQWQIDVTQRPKPADYIYTETEVLNYDSLDERITKLENGGGSGTGGEDGATFTPSVSEDGTLSWQNDKDLPNPTPVNIKGEDGKSGVYVGSGDMPDGYNVQIDPNGDTVTLEDIVEEAAKMVGTTPDYIIAEAERVTANVQATRTAKTFVMACCTDIHLKDGDTDDNHLATLVSAQCAGMGISEIKKRIHLDLVSLLGDYSFMDANDYSAEQTMKDLVLAKKTLDLGEGNVLWSIGNHDWCYGAGVDRLLTEDEIYAYIGANSDGVKSYANIERGYGYIDFDNYKIRVVNLNTCDCKDLTDNGYDFNDAESNFARLEFISPTQMRWLADEALDFTDKGEGWGVVFVSHHPLDYGNAWFTDLLKMLEAYRSGSSVTLNLYKYHDGTAWTKQEEVFDFSSITPAEIVCNIHGHSHNCGSAKVSSSTCTTNSTSGVTPWLWRFCVPNMCVGRENEKWNTIHGEVDENGNAIYHRKETDTAKATAFNVVSIDRKNRKIYAHIFGAGRDREFYYGEDVVPESSNLLDMSVRTLDSSYTDNYIESTAAHTMDNAKVYAVSNENKRGAYPTAKFTDFVILENNGFTASCSSSSGYRLEFPINVKGGKTYTLNETCDTDHIILLLKYNADTTFNSFRELTAKGSGQQSATFTTDSGYLYSIAFPFGSGTRTYTNISLLETAN
jgi:hypothetical protein